MNVLRRIIWAIDSYPEDLGLTAKAASALQSLIVGSDAMIEPVCVRRPKPFSSKSPEYFIEGEEILERAERNLKAGLEASPVPGLKPLKSLIAEGDSVRLMVDALIQYALETESTLIALSTHARTGVKRLFFGSFAETLLHQSPIPVFLTNPAVRDTNNPHAPILFPTDFSEPSRDAFEEVVSLAGQRGSPIYLFHKFDYPVMAGSFPYVPAPVLEPLRQLVSDLKASGDHWTLRARERGVEVKFHFSRGRWDVPTAITRFARRAKVGMTALASQSGPSKSLLLGNTTRQVVRHSPCPVLVIHGVKEQREAVAAA